MKLTILLICCCHVLGFVAPAHGATIDVVYSFAPVVNGPHNPQGGLTQDSDGTFYGTTYGGGSGNSFGTVFKVTPTGTMTKLFSFNNSNGARPQAGLIRGNDGKFYGTTSQGGLNNKGTVFGISTNGILSGSVSFNGTGTVGNGFNGSFPYGGLVEGSPGVFYGTTFQGGSNDMGTVFRYNHNGVL